jgi:hypothetical protein
MFNVLRPFCQLSASDQQIDAAKAVLCVSILLARSSACFNSGKKVKSYFFAFYPLFSLPANSTLELFFSMQEGNS